MARYATFDDNGILLARYDENITPVPDGATLIPDEIFAEMMKYSDGYWSLVDGSIIYNERQE